MHYANEAIPAEESNEDVHPYKQKSAGIYM